jgi:hypothetical protein
MKHHAGVDLTLLGMAKLLRGENGKKESPGKEKAEDGKTRKAKAFSALSLGAKMAVSGRLGGCGRGFAGRGFLLVYKPANHTLYHVRIPPSG